MAVLSLVPECKDSTDNNPLLMEHSECHCSDSHDRHEHVIDITRGGTASSSNSQRDENNGSNGLRHQDVPSIIVQVPTIQSSSAPNSRNSTFTRRGNNYGQRNRSPLNSGLWISIELAVNVSQIIAAIIVLSLSRNEHPQTPLFAWIVGYTAGCVATLPHLYWRYTRLNNQGSDQESAAHTQPNSTNNNPDSSYISMSVTHALEESGSATSQNGQESGNARRFNSLVEHFKMALDCFFAVWFVVGNVWIFGGHSSASSAPNLYRLCIVFLTFSCIGYAMPFILCATICCCLPCIISILGLREDISQNRGAAPELINALPIYKFKAKRSQIRENSETDPESLGEGGIFAAGTEKERNVSAEDAVCCICLAKYLDNEELRELPCSHFFHTDCVDKWLKINASCPLCKYGVEDVTTSISRRSSFLRG